MPKPFRPKAPLIQDDFPDDGGKRFPIVEVFGYDRHLTTPQARTDFNRRHCPFTGTPCEKFDQYGFGYCSVQYKSKFDTAYQIYAVCDHRLDGPPVRAAVTDYFGANDRVRLVPELKLTAPDQSFDFIAIDPTTDDFVAVETQSIDLRGGGVGPAWLSITDGTPRDWRAYFSAEAKQKGRGDTVAYGVNLANITKRLGVQVVEKGSLLKALGAKLYV